MVTIAKFIYVYSLNNCMSSILLCPVYRSKNILVYHFNSELRIIVKTKNVLSD